MNPSEKRIIYFHVNDNCNFKCNDCHWFSEKINRLPPPSISKYLNFLSRIKWVDRIVFSGGEPTLWPELSQLVNKLGGNIGEVAIYTNGSNVKILDSIRTKIAVYLRISIHAEARWENIRRIVELAILRNWMFKFYGYVSTMPKYIPDWFNYKIKVNQEQVIQGNENYSYLLGKEVLCQPRMIYIGTDGEAYCCEKGLRTKNKKYAEGFSLDHGEIRCGFRKCVVDEDCLGSIQTEQYIISENECSGKSSWTT